MAKKAPNPIDKHVGSRVRMRRLMLDMSQQWLAEALGLTFQQVHKYEKGTNRIGASRLQQMSYILQVPVEFFFEGAPNAFATGAFKDSALVSVIALNELMRAGQLLAATTYKHFEIFTLVPGTVYPPGMVLECAQIAYVPCAPPPADLSSPAWISTRWSITPSGSL